MLNQENVKAINSMDTSELRISEQKKNMDAIVSKALSLTADNKVISDDVIAITTDIHGDFFSLLVSLLECGAVKIKRNNYLYYDTVNHTFLSQDKFNQIPEDRVEYSGLCVFPNPYIIKDFNANFYILGDICDKGPESVACFAFLFALLEKYKKINKQPIHIAFGNHESQKGLVDNSVYSSYYHIIKKMVKKNYIQTGYLIGKGDDVTALWHSRLLDTDLENIFQAIFRLPYIPNLFGYFLDEFKINDEVKLYNKIAKELNPNDMSMDYLLEKFNCEELGKIKIFLGNAIVKNSLATHKNFLNDLTVLNKNGVVIDFLRTYIDRRGGCCNPLFWNDETVYGNPVMDQIVGHDIHIDEMKVLTATKGSILDLDFSRSCGSLGFGTSLSATTYYKKDANGNINLFNISKQTAYKMNRFIKDAVTPFNIVRGGIYLADERSNVKESKIIRSNIIKVSNENIYKNLKQNTNETYLPVSESLSSISSYLTQQTQYETRINISPDDVMFAPTYQTPEEYLYQAILNTLHTEEKIITNIPGYSGAHIDFNSMEKHLSNIVDFCKKNDDSTVLKTILNNCSSIYVKQTRVNGFSHSDLVNEMSLNVWKMSRFISAVDRLLNKADLSPEEKIKKIKEDGITIIREDEDGLSFINNALAKSLSTMQF